MKTIIRIQKVYDTILEETKQKLVVRKDSKTFVGPLFCQKMKTQILTDIVDETHVSGSAKEIVMTCYEMLKKHQMLAKDDKTLHTMLHWQYANGLTNECITDHLGVASDTEYLATMRTGCISVKSLYEKYGETLSFAEIRYSDDEGDSWYDLYADGKLVCMDGERCRAIDENDDSISLQNIEGENPEIFHLSKDEFETAYFSLQKKEDESKKRMLINDNDVIFWQNDGKEYAMNIQRDDCPTDPRKNMDNMASMWCSHRRYSLGDFDHNTSLKQWITVLLKTVPEDELATWLRANMLRWTTGDSNHEIVTSFCGMVLENKDDSWKHGMKALCALAVVLPLWLYDHSGITISVGERIYPYNDRWYSGQVGFIALTKHKMLTELQEIVYDKHGNPVRVYISGKNWHYKTVPFTEQTWEEGAINAIKAEVETYNQYLTGDTWRYIVYSTPIPFGNLVSDSLDDWNEEDRRSGFYGNDLLENGMLNIVGYGLTEAIENGRAKIKDVLKKPNAGESPKEEKKDFPQPLDPDVQPVVTIVYSESDKMQEGEQMSLARADALFKVFDDEKRKERTGPDYTDGGYDKIDFRIDFTFNGKRESYEGRQDFGDGEGSLVKHIKTHQEYYKNDENWKNFVLRNDGAEAWETEVAQREMILNEMIPYFKMHCDLYKTEQKAVQTLELIQTLESDTEKKATYTAFVKAIFAYVDVCRKKINNGESDLPDPPEFSEVAEMEAYKVHVENEIAQEAASYGMTVEEYAANGYEPPKKTSIHDNQRHEITMQEAAETALLALSKKNNK